MVEQILKWRASDGSEWNTYDLAFARDSLIAKVEMAMEGLRSMKIDSDYYVQHSREAAFSSRRKLFELVKEYILGDHYPNISSADADTVHPSSIVGRIIDDSSHTPINRAWSRLMCINFETFREYNQPYYVSHASEATVEIK